MKNILKFTIIVLLMTVVVSLAGCALPGAEESAEAPVAMETVDVVSKPVQASGEIISDAVVVPVHHATLSLPTGGIIAELLVREGDSVKAGAPLVRLNAAQQAAAVAQAEASVQSAEARLAELQAGPRLQEIEVAKTAVEAAEAQLAKLEQGAMPEDIKAAQAAVAGAQAALRKLREGPSRSEVVAAQAEVERAQATMQQAQAAYDRVKLSADIALRPESLQLHQATNDYNAALARMKALDERITSADIAGARSEVNQAQAQLNALKAPVRSADLAVAQAEIHRTKAQLALIEAGTRSEVIAAADADVAAAEAALEQARVALAETELKAPSAGTIAELDVKVGEQVSPGASLVILADLSKWQIETDDLTELDVVDIQVGDPATITFDAIPGLDIDGTVKRIKDIGEDKLGDIIYTVVVEPADTDERMRWNMTAVVTIE